MTKSIKRLCILAAAVGAVSLSSISLAQYRIDTGHANDANNRIGGGGYNDAGRVGGGLYNGVTGNDIVTGNVTGGKEFRGRISYGDARAFRGGISRPSDSFSRGSAASPYAGASANNASSVKTYYGDTYAAPPPSGFVRSGYGTGGYSPAPDPSRIGSDLRLGQIYDRPSVALPSAGTTILPGPVDASNNDTLITASSLYGVRTWNPGNLSDQQFMTRYANGMFGENSMKSNLTDLEIGAMRREILQATGDSMSSQRINDAVKGSDKPETPDPNNISKPLAQPIESPDNSALPTGALQSAMPAVPLKNGLETGEGFSARMLVPAAKQSAANAMLQARLDEVNGNKPENDVDRAREFNKQLAAKNAADKAGGPGAPGALPGARPGGAAPGGATPGTTPGAAPRGTTPGAGNDATPTPMVVPGPTDIGAKKAPPQIKSFADGVKAKGLADVLKKAEDLMKEGKWYSAIEQYDTARQVSPNNMLIMVGRANAELGGSYYKPAEAHIRTAFSQDPAMMEGKFDLTSMIGDERLRFLVKDLKDTAGKNPTQAMPVFLLSYISYNTGDDRMAGAYLKLAQDRAPQSDTFYGMVRQHWVLPKDDGAGPENK